MVKYTAAHWEKNFYGETEAFLFKNGDVVAEVSPGGIIRHFDVPDEKCDRSFWHKGIAIYISSTK